MVISQKTRKKPKVKHRVERENLKVKAYPVLCDAVARGMRFGRNRVEKYDLKDEEAYDNIEMEIVNAICESFGFEWDEK